MVHEILTAKNITLLEKKIKEYIKQYPIAGYGTIISNIITKKDNTLEVSIKRERSC